MRVRLGLIRSGIRVTFNADDRQNDHRRGLIPLGVAKAHNTALVWEFDYVAHQPLSSAGSTAPQADPLLSPS